ncbi:energy transducer TonB [Acidocella aquatica]|uniref:energy transducer TonB n=1 Tax=Acidocella aquatica TaxID=1922313 RepID=UPI0024E05560|nr:energy transducer TonB [Acidocella aquatica]
MALHVLVIAFFLLFAWRHQPQEDNQSPPGISVVFDNGGAQQTTAPQAPVHGPISQAQAPPPAAPPPPPQTQQPQAEVNLNMPDMPQATVQSAPQSQPRPQPRPTPRPAPPAPRKYVVMNNMSYGTPSPPMPHAPQALNLSLPMSDAQAVNAPELTIKGNVGADWNAALSKWVNDHKYYPEAAAEQGQQGSVQVEFTVDRKGNVTGLHMLSSSGSPFLDQAWMGMFADNQLPPFPPGTKDSHITVDATMHYEIVP